MHDNDSEGMFCSEELSLDVEIFFMENGSNTNKKWYKIAQNKLIDK
jgi:hypothetical protein